MMTNLMTILEKMVSISSNCPIVFLSSPSFVLPFSFVRTYVRIDCKKKSEFPIKKRRLTHRKCCKLSVFRRFLFCLFQTYSSSALLSRRRLYFCTYCHEFDSYNYPNILFHVLSTLRIISLIKREMLEKVRKFKDFY